MCSTWQGPGHNVWSAGISGLQFHVVAASGSLPLGLSTDNAKVPPRGLNADWCFPFLHDVPAFERDLVLRERLIL